MSTNNTNNQQASLWERRYALNDRVAKYPFDQIVSMVMSRFASEPDRSEIRILDYGCGGGNNLWFLAREGFSAWALDVSKSALELSQKILRENQIPLSEERFHLLDSDSLPYPDNFFHAIIDRESLCQSHLKQIKSRIGEFKRILAPNGWYLGINFSDSHQDLKYAEAIGGGDFSNFTEGLFKNMGQRHLFSASQILELFNDWSIDSLAELKITPIIGDNPYTSEFIIAAQPMKESNCI